VFFCVCLGKPKPRHCLEIILLSNPAHRLVPPKTRPAIAQTDRQA
jgi:hypothetical protein